MSSISFFSKTLKIGRLFYFASSPHSVLHYCHVENVNDAHIL